MPAFAAPFCLPVPDYITYFQMSFNLTTQTLYYMNCVQINLGIMSKCTARCFWQLLRCVCNWKSHTGYFLVCSGHFLRACRPPPFHFRRTPCGQLWTMFLSSNASNKYPLVMPCGNAPRWLGTDIYSRRHVCPKNILFGYFQEITLKEVKITRKSINNLRMANFPLFYRAFSEVISNNPKS